MISFGLVLVDFTTTFGDTDGFSTGLGADLAGGGTGGVLAGGGLDFGLGGWNTTGGVLGGAGMELTVLPITGSLLGGGVLGCRGW